MAGKINSDDLERYSIRLGDALDEQMRRVMSPDDRKSDKPLRRFSIREMADLCIGMKYNTLRSHLKTLKGLPSGRMEPGNKKTYALEEIHEIQRALFQAGKLPDGTQPWRLPGEETAKILVYNLKGGVAKSTLVANCAEVLAARGYRVLVCDLDPQASVSDLFDVRADLDNVPSIYDVLRYESADDGPVPAHQAIAATYFPNIDILPGSIALTEFEYETAQAAASGVPFYQRLQEKLAPIEDSYDVIIFDTPPHMSFCVITAVYAASGMIIPLSAGMLDVVSLEKFLELASSTLRSIENVVPEKKFDFLRFVLTRYQPSDPAQLQLSSFLRHTLGEAMLRTDLLSSTAIADAGNTMNPLLEVDPSEFTRKTYDRIAESVIGISLEIEQEIMAARGRKSSVREVA
ncbi:AAA family ATPase [Citreimonas salinaria]|uniref:Chromosome partitioning protein n=1 Tax=Citreimonas salinaria TaxID=321339 RepID=A0A1H3NBA3_9RHOB|nr:AAA family ATPase [Citreimonas salinaria]SDY86033.1 chromosome partitioning protein [Citreimonas salinaria]